MPTRGGRAAVHAAVSSVVVPADQEAAELPATRAHLREGLASTGIDHEIVVVDNASTDATASTARAGGASVVHEPHRQISRARSTGAAATGAWLLFVDADARPSPELLGRAVVHLRSGACGGGALVAMGEWPNGVCGDGDRPVPDRAMVRWRRRAGPLSGRMARHRRRPG